MQELCEFWSLFNNLSHFNHEANFPRKGKQ